MEARDSGCPAASVEAKSTATRRLQRVIKAAIPEVRACYNAGLERAHGGRDPQGRFVVQWNVGPLGEVYRPRIKEGSFPDPEVQRCVLRRVRALRFEPPINGWLGISYPFKLKATKKTP